MEKIRERDSMKNILLNSINYTLLTEKQNDTNRIGQRINYHYKKLTN